MWRQRWRCVWVVRRGNACMRSACCAVGLLTSGVRPYTVCTSRYVRCAGRRAASRGTA
ncbi:hypothetical protein KCP69_10685 [Salmonella enterica subsp. enterica]|nr:hypothetical protein KCP69_10685 [Salmonella enterica subsp. enterica]